MKHFIQISDCHIDDNTQTMGVNSHENLTKVVDKAAGFTYLYRVNVNNIPSAQCHTIK
jgi:hypothetical protein